LCPYHGQIHKTKEKKVYNELFIAFLKEKQTPTFQYYVHCSNHKNMEADYYCPVEN
jgi:hypothetical protein